MADWFESLLKGFDRAIQSTGSNTQREEQQAQQAASSDGFDPALFAGASGVANALGRTASNAGSISTQRMSTPSYEYAVYPAIGFCRVGDYPLDPNDTSTFNLGPEVGDWPPSTHTVKRSHGGVKKIKKQACRFKVFMRTVVDGKVTAEKALQIGTEVKRGEKTTKVRSITWQVEVANRKAVGPNIFDAGVRNFGRRNNWAEHEALVMRPGAKEISGANARKELARDDGGVMPDAFRTATNPNGITSLGTIATDANGNLLVFGGDGKAVGDASASPKLNSTFNNDDWFDDIFDGIVVAKVEFEDGTSAGYEIVRQAWVVSGPPDYAPFVPNVVSAWDVLRDLAVRQLGNEPSLYAGGKFLDSYQPHFDDDIKPILDATIASGTSSSDAHGHHGTLTGLKHDSKPVWLMNFLRKPDELAADARLSSYSSGTMPKLLLEEVPATKELALTPTQYWLMHLWAQGKCLAGGVASKEFESQRMTRAQLQQAIGLALYPGIEVTRTLVNKAWFRTKPRFEYRLVGKASRLEPGMLTEEMALPWHSDFYACGEEWWPSVRPSQSPWLDTVADSDEMISKWPRLAWVNAAGTQTDAG